jgi:imidazoleglycerol-phosphate dehydratase / histidinol-phosphatase
MKKKILFIDRDGTLIDEPKDTFQIDSVDKFKFLPGVISALSHISKNFSFELVLVTNQDGLGTASFPKEHFWPLQNLMMRTLESEGIVFKAVHIDDSLPEQNSPNRKPGTGMLQEYFSTEYDIENSYVIGDRVTDIELAKNLAAKAIFIGTDKHESALCVNSWEEIVSILSSQRSSKVVRTTKETSIEIELSVDGSGASEVNTGIGFFDHMLTLFSFHSGIDLKIAVSGDLHIDDHHTIEDVGLALGQAFKNALGSKIGIKRYGHSLLPMDESLAIVALDWSGRPYLKFDALFQQDKVGTLSTEMVEHFFHSFAQNAGLTLHMKVEGSNDHHKSEALFKGFGRALAESVKVGVGSAVVPSTKGVL